MRSNSYSSFIENDPEMAEPSFRLELSGVR